MLSEQNKNEHNILWFVIERQLELKQLSAREVARRANFSRSLITSIKQGKIKKPSFELICKLADVFELSLDEFRKEMEKWKHKP